MGKSIQHVLGKFAALSAIATMTASPAAANEPLAFKSFVLGAKYPAPSRIPKARCAAPEARKIPSGLPADVRQRAKSVAHLEASIKGGDLICTVPNLTIAGQPVHVTRLTFYSERLLKIEMNLNFPVPKYYVRGQRTQTWSTEVSTIIAALTEKYGKSSPYNTWIEANQYAGDKWSLADGEITVERPKEQIHRATVTFSSKSLEQAEKDRWLALQAWTSGQAATRELAEEKRLKADSRDL